LEVNGDEDGESEVIGLPGMTGQQQKLNRMKGKDEGLKIWMG
jgi:hypothetical protein